MSSIFLGGSSFEPYEPSTAVESEPARLPDEPEAAPAPYAGRDATVLRNAALPADQMARLPIGDLIAVAKRCPEAAARLPLAKLAELGNACPEALSMIYHSDAATVPARVPGGYATGTHVWVKDSGIDLPFLVQQGVNAWQGKEFKPATGEMIDHVGGLIPNSKAKAYVGDVNAAIQGAAGGEIVAPVNPDGRGALITDYTQKSQAFGVKLHWIDEFRQLPSGALLGVSYWMDGAEPTKWSSVLLDAPK